MGCDQVDYLDGNKCPYTWMGTCMPYEGYLKDVNVNIGYNGPATASLTIVSEDGTYDIGAADITLKCTDGFPKLLRLDFLDLEWLMYPVSYSINNGSGGRILSVELVEVSLDYLQRSLIINKKFKKAKEGDNTGIIFIGKEYFEDPESTMGAMIERDDMLLTYTPDPGIGNTAGPSDYKYPKLAHIANTTFGKWLWTPRDLEQKIAQICPISPTVSQILFWNDDIYFDSSGTVQSVLSMLTGVFGGVFFWDPINKWLDWMGNLDAMTAYLVAQEASADKSNMISEREDVTLRETQVTSQAQRAELAGGDSGNPKYSKLGRTKVLSPIFGTLYHQCGNAALPKLFDKEQVLGDENKPTRRQFQALNLLKAFSLGTEFVKVYILYKKALAQLGRGGAGHLENKWENAKDGAAPFRADWELVDEIFPDPVGCNDSDSSDSDTHHGDGLVVNAPGPPDPKLWDGKKVIQPSSPYYIADMLTLWLNRNPFVDPRLDKAKKVKAGDILGLMRHAMLAYVKSYRPPLKAPQKQAGKEAAETQAWLPSHPILTDNWANRSYSQLEAWAELASKYFVARGAWEPPCDPEDNPGKDRFIYSHKNWLQPYEAVAPSPDHAVAEYINSKDVDIFQKLGEAFEPSEGGLEGFLNPGTPGVTAADFVENISFGGEYQETVGEKIGESLVGDGTTGPGPLQIKRSCLKPISAVELEGEEAENKANCTIENINELHIWERDASQLILPEEINGAREITEEFYFFEPVEGQSQGEELASESRYSVIVLPKFTEADKTDQKMLYSYYPEVAGGYDFENPEVADQIEFTDIDGMDSFLCGIDIGIDVNGFIRAPNITYIMTPDRFERNEGRFEPYCNRGLFGSLNFYQQSLNAQTYRGSHFEALGLIPPLGEGVGGGEEGRGEFGSNMGYDAEEECDKGKEAKTPYTGITQATKNKIIRNLRKKSVAFWDANQNTDHSYHATFQIIGSARLPSIKAGLSNLSVSMTNDGPMVTYSVGNRKFNRTRNDQKMELIKAEDGTQKLQEDSFMKRFSQKFKNNLDQPTPIARLHKEGMAKIAQAEAAKNQTKSDRQQR